MANRMLMTGINTYPSCPLQGCVNDIKNVTARLLTPGDPRYGFQPVEVTTLLDNNATTSNMKSALQAFVSGVSPLDRLYFHYSGHGATADNCDLPGQFQNCICPVDFDFSPEKMITDKFFHQLFSTLPNGIIFNWFSDSCHSADLDRIMTMRPHKPRLFPGSKDRSRQVQTVVPGALLNVALMSGCGLDQTSADTQDPVTGQPCGAATWGYLAALTQLPASAPWTQLGQLLDRILRQHGYTQQPAPDGGRIDRPMLQA